MEPRAKGLFVAVLTTASFAGCVGSDPEDPSQDLKMSTGSEGNIGDPHVVIALFDSGINPYAPIFYEPGAPEPRVVIPHLPDYVTIRLTRGFSYQESVRIDALEQLQRGVLYWFQDTRILAYSFDEFSDDHHMPVLDEQGHGTGLASLVAHANPEAYVLAVETWGDNERALPWAANQSWIDIVSLSIGAPANLPAELAGDRGRSEALQLAVDAGKLTVAAAGNELLPSHVGTYQGPPWVISVGGANSTTRGEAVLSAKTPEFVSEWTVRVAKHETTKDEWATVSGTSQSTPIVAGAISRAILEVRKAWEHEGNIEEGAFAVRKDGERLTNADLRSALNATAVYWSHDDFEPGLDSSCPACPIARATVPVAPSVTNTPVGPWLQMGWGFVNESIVPQLVNVLLGKEPLPEKPAGAVQFMEQVYEARKAYWALPRAFP